MCYVDGSLESKFYGDNYPVTSGWDILMKNKPALFLSGAENRQKIATRGLVLFLFLSLLQSFINLIPAVGADNLLTFSDNGGNPEVRSAGISYHVATDGHDNNQQPANKLSRFKYHRTGSRIPWVKIGMV